MMSNQTVHELTITLLNYIINMIKSDTKPNGFTVFCDDTLKIFLTATSIHFCIICITCLDGAVASTPYNNKGIQ